MVLRVRLIPKPLLDGDLVRLTAAAGQIAQALRGGLNPALPNVQQRPVDPFLDPGFLFGFPRLTDETGNYVFDQKHRFASCCFDCARAT
jgi:hypothetical protein